MPPPNSAWKKLEEHRKRAAAHPLNILVWGPGDDGSEVYKARCTLRDKLIADGHHAVFSEDLQKGAGSLADPVHDEMLQAASADAIVMLYGSRGTQTEHDRILDNHAVLGKTIIVIDQGMLTTIQTKSLSATAWIKTAKISQVISYPDEVGIPSAINRVLELVKELRQAAYVRELHAGGLL